jgi:hypothetical protein
MQNPDFYTYGSVCSLLFAFENPNGLLAASLVVILSKGKGISVKNTIIGVRVSVLMLKISLSHA